MKFKSGAEGCEGMVHVFGETELEYMDEEKRCQG